MNEQFLSLMARVESLVARIESVLPQPLSAPDWGTAIAWRYRKRSSGHGSLEAVRHVGAMQLGLGAATLTRFTHGVMKLCTSAVEISIQDVSPLLGTGGAASAACWANSR